MALDAETTATLLALAKQSYDGRDRPGHQAREWPIEEGLAICAAHPAELGWRARFLIERAHYVSRAVTGSHAESVAIVEEALAIVTVDGDPVLYGLAACQYALSERSPQMTRRRVQLAREALERLQAALAAGYRSPWDISAHTVAGYTAFRIAKVYADVDEHRNALDAIRRGRAIPGLITLSPYWYGELLRLQSSTMRELAMFAEHAAFLDEVDELAAQLGMTGEMTRHRLRGADLQLRGDLARARRSYELAYAALPQNRRPAKRGNVANEIAFLSIRCNDLDRGEQALLLADRAWAEHGKATTGAAVTRRHRSRIAAARGEWAQAVDELLASIAILRSKGSNTYSVTIARLIETIAEAADDGFDLTLLVGRELLTSDGPTPLLPLRSVVDECHRLIDGSDTLLTVRFHRSLAILSLCGLVAEDAVDEATLAYEASRAASEMQRGRSAGLVARARHVGGAPDVALWSRRAVEHLEVARSGIVDEYDRVRIANESRAVYLLAWEQAGLSGDVDLAVRVAEAARGTLLVGLLHGLAGDEPDSDLAQAIRRQFTLAKATDALGINDESGDGGDGGGAGDSAADEEAEGGDQPAAGCATAEPDGKTKGDDAVRHQNLLLEQQEVSEDLLAISGELPGVLFPDPLDVAALRAIAGDRWVLYVDAENGRVFSVLVGPGNAHVPPPQTLSSDAWLTLRQFGDPAHSPHLGAETLESLHDELHELGLALLPGPVRTAVRAASEAHPLELLIVPTGSLYAFPFAACVVDGEPLLRRAVVTIAPSLRLIEAVEARPVVVATEPPLGFVDSALPGVADETARMSELFPGWSPIDNADDLRAALVHGDAAAWLSISVHGELDRGGLRQQLQLGGEDRLTVADCFDLRFPRISIFGACWIGSLSHLHGADPVGFAVACLIRGVQTFIGGLFPVSDAATGSILATVYSELQAGAPVPRALRTAQLEFLDNHPNATLRQWSGLTAIGSSAPDLHPAVEAKLE